MTSILQKAVAIGLIVFVLPVASQTYFKCTTENGKVEFSDRQCGAGLKGELRTKQSNSIDASGARRQFELYTDRSQQETQRLRQETEDRRKAEAARSTANVCPSERDISNMENSASSITLRDQDRVFLHAEIRRAWACRREGGQYTADDWNRIKEAQSSVNRVDARDRDTGRSKAESIHSIAASDIERARMAADKELEAQRRSAEAAERAAAAAEAAAVAARNASIANGALRPSRITDCRFGTCRDNVGGQYKSTGGNNYRSSSGQSCQMVNGQMRCY